MCACQRGDGIHRGCPDRGASSGEARGSHATWRARGGAPGAGQVRDYKEVRRRGAPGRLRKGRPDAGGTRDDRPEQGWGRAAPAA